MCLTSKNTCINAARETLYKPTLTKNTKISKFNLLIVEHLEEI